MQHLESLMFLTSETDMSLQKGRMKLLRTVTVHTILCHLVIYYRLASNR